MKNLTLEPDDHMKWIYDTQHPDYDSDKAKDLRKRREHALKNMPRWMMDIISNQNKPLRLNK